MPQVLAEGDTLIFLVKNYQCRGSNAKETRIFFVNQDTIGLQHYTPFAEFAKDEEYKENKKNILKYLKKYKHEIGSLRTDLYFLNKDYIPKGIKLNTRYMPETKIETDSITKELRIKVDSIPHFFAKTEYKKVLDFYKMVEYSQKPNAESFLIAGDSGSVSVFHLRKAKRRPILIKDHRWHYEFPL